MENHVDSRPPPPAWIDAKFVQNALKQGDRNSGLHVESVDVEYACREGAGYASLVFRAAATVKNVPDAEPQIVTVIVKVAHESGALKEVFDKLDAFQIESLVLYEAMTEIHDILESVEGASFRRLTAKCHSYGKQPTDYLVLEDLTSSGFQLAEAGKPLDLDHCLLVFRSYGRLHGASAFFLQQQPKYVEVIGKDCYTDDSALEYFGQMVEKIFAAAAEKLESCPGYEKYAAKYNRLSGTAVEQFADAVKRKTRESTLKVLTHGDCWKNNLMFKYSEGVTEVRFVDFQTSCVANPVRDLVYSLYANASEEVHRQHVDRLLDEYHSTLVGTLRALGMDDAADAYPLEQLKRDMDDFAVMGLVYSTMSSFMLASEELASEITKSFDDFSVMTDVMKRSYENPRSVSYLKYVTMHFESKGVI